MAGGRAPEQREIEALEHRIGKYAKEPADERFLSELNDYLGAREQELYKDLPVEFPFVFVVGAPRSGTTLLSQLLAYCLDVGYITNVAARFWRAPVHGVRLSRLITGSVHDLAFASDYARTPSPGGIHEFSYFWSRWLHKHSFDDIVHARAREDAIDWDGLRLTLANVQSEFQAPLVAKNIHGSHHAARLSEALDGNVMWVLIERDPLDVAVSILEARRRYYGDPSRWWSYVPPEYPLLEGLPYQAQISGQVHYLGRFYERLLAESGEERSLRVTYAELCADPKAVLERVGDRMHETFGHRPTIRREPPDTFTFREYRNRDTEKRMFEGLMKGFG